MSIKQEEIIYKDINERTEPKKFHGFYAHDSLEDSKRPVVIVIHDWSGQNDFARNKAVLLAELGYVGFALDMYGEKQEGKTKEEKTALMSPLMENRTLILDRIYAAINAAKSLPMVDATKIALMGFCFGGLCVLDFARAGEKVALGAISFHGLLQASPLNMPKKIHTKVLALHGYNDPMVPMEHVQDFTQEMNMAQADWQIHMYGNTLHAFTNPLANDPAFGTVYDAAADRRSWLAACNFLEEVFSVPME